MARTACSGPSGPCLRTFPRALQRAWTDLPNLVIVASGDERALVPAAATRRQSRPAQRTPSAMPDGGVPAGGLHCIHSGAEKDLHALYCESMRLQSSTTNVEMDGIEAGSGKGCWREGGEGSASSGRRQVTERRKLTVLRPTTALRDGPGNVLGGHLDVAELAVNAVLVASCQ